MSGREKKKLNVNMSKLVRNIVIEEKDSCSCPRNMYLVLIKRETYHLPIGCLVNINTYRCDKQ